MEELSQEVVTVRNVVGSLLALTCDTGSTQRTEVAIERCLCFSFFGVHLTCKLCYVV